MGYKTGNDVTLSELGVPMRKRTEKACDSCRRRKTKCDGKMQCKACIGMGLECSFGHKIKQARGPQYVAHLENRLKELESGQERRRALTNWKSSDSSNASRRTSVSSSSRTPERSFSDIPSLSNSPGSAPDVSVQSPGRKISSEDVKSKYNVQSHQQKFGLSVDTMPHQMTRTASEILTDAKMVLDGLSPTNHTARYAAECIESLRQNYYHTNPQFQGMDDFTLFEADNYDMSGVNLGFDYLTPDKSNGYINPAQAFPTDFQNWPVPNYTNPFQPLSGSFQDDRLPLLDQQRVQ